MGGFRTALVALVLVGISTACGTATGNGVSESGPKRLYNPAAGLSIEYPAWWDATTSPLTGVIWPPERLAAATYSLAEVEPGSDCVPGPALAALPRDGALLHLFEYTERQGARGKSKAFPKRPARFTLQPESLLNYECAGLSYAIVFSDGGRRFQAHVWFGEAATDQTKREALDVMNSLRLEPAG